MVAYPSRAQEQIDSASSDLVVEPPEHEGRDFHRQAPPRLTGGPEAQRAQIEAAHGSPVVQGLSDERLTAAERR